MAWVIEVRRLKFSSFKKNICHKRESFGYLNKLHHFNSVQGARISLILGSRTDTSDSSSAIRHIQWVSLEWMIQKQGFL